MPLSAGARVGPYEVIGPIGAGGMGVVYKARDTRLNRSAAIKVLPPDAVNPDRKERFMQEARTASALNHPNIVHIYDIDAVDDQQCIIMEYVEGTPLDQLLKTRPLPLAEVLRYAVQVADALAAAHAAGIVHRDVKPGNIIITAKGLVKVLDFGLAKQVTPEILDSAAPTHAAPPRTKSGLVLGTVPYMSPEQARGEAVDARSDIFSFGATLYEMIAGRRPFGGNSDIAAMNAILNTDPRPVGELARGVPPSLEHLLAQCLRKDPRRRIQHMEDVRIELEQIRDDVTGGVRSGRRARPTVVAAAVVLIAAAAAGFLLWNNNRPSRPVSEPVLRRLTVDVGLSTHPALSPDGTLIAFASDRAGEGNLDIWVQQVGGTEPVRVTRDRGDESTPVFSPDGTQIAFRSERDEGGIYLVSALGGEPALVAAKGYNPRFSPDGQWLAYNTGIPGAGGGGTLTFGSGKVYIVKPTGSTPRQLQPAAKAASVGVWSPDSQHLLMLADFETGFEPSDWWVTPLEGRAIRVSREPLQKQGLRGPRPIAWLAGNRIVFSAISGDSRNTWVATLSPTDWQVHGSADRLTSGAVVEGSASVAVSNPSTLRVAFSTIEDNVDLWSVPLAAGGIQPATAAVRLTHDAFRELHPTLTADGKTLIYSSDGSLHVRHLTTGRVAKLISMAPEHLFKPVVSADGTKLAFWRIERAAQPAATFATDLQRTPDGSLLAATPRQLPALAPEGSGWPWGWSPDNRSLWYDTARWPKLAPNHLYNPATGERLAQLAHKEHDLAFLQFSPDGRWIAFMEPLTENLNRLVAATMRGGTPAAEQEWVEIADPEPGAYPWHAWSPNGDIIYFTSARDGFVCIWAQRVAPDTMRLVDSAVALHHAHSARLSIGNIGPNLRGLAAARDKVVFTMSEMTGNIWITDIDNP